MKVIIGDRRTGKTTQLIGLMQEDINNAHYIGFTLQSCDEAYQLARLQSAKPWDRTDFLTPIQAVGHLRFNSKATLYIDDWHLIGQSDYLARLRNRVAAIAINLHDVDDVIIMPTHDDLARMQQRYDGRPELMEGGR